MLCNQHQRRIQCVKGLLSLPVELLQHIASFLPRENEALLAFTCKDLCRVVGTSSWTGWGGPYSTYPDSHKARRSKETLLPLLARDMDPKRAVICFGHGMIHTATLQYPEGTSTAARIQARFGGQPLERYAKPIGCKYDFAFATMRARIRCWEVQLAIAGSIRVRSLSAYERPKCRLPTNARGTLATVRIAHDATMYSRVIRNRFIVAIQLRLCIPITTKSDGSWDVAAGLLAWGGPGGVSKIRLQVPTGFSMESTDPYPVIRCKEVEEALVYDGRDTEHIIVQFSRVNDRKELLVRLDVFVDAGNGYFGQGLFRNSYYDGDLNLMLLTPESVVPVDKWEAFAFGEMVNENFEDHEERLEELRPKEELWKVVDSRV